MKRRTVKYYALSVSDDGECLSKIFDSEKDANDFVSENPEWVAIKIVE